MITGWNLFFFSLSLLQKFNSESLRAKQEQQKLDEIYRICGEIYSLVGKFRKVVTENAKQLILDLIFPEQERRYKELDKLTG